MKEKRDKVLKAFFLYLLPSLLIATSNLEESSLKQELKRIESLFFIEDFPKAHALSLQLLEKYPSSKEAQSFYIQALVKENEGEKALKHYLLWEENLSQDPVLLEKICWAFLEEGANSSQYSVQIASLLGAFFTQDAKAVLILQKMMKSSHAVVRGLAVQLSTYYKDEILEKTILDLLKEESSWPVRLELIQAIGKFQIETKIPYLEKLLKKKGNPLPEKMAAIQALVDMYDEVSLERILLLTKSKRAYLRVLACRLIAHFSCKEAKELLLPLFYDESPEVRIEALNTFALTFFSEMSKEEGKIIRKLAQEKHPLVAITASWILFLQNPEKEFLLRRWLEGNHKEHRWIASSALSTAGQRGLALSRKMLKKSKDINVQVNLALGLIRHGEKQDLEKEVLLKALKIKGQKWMKDLSYNYLFPVIAPSTLTRQGAFFSFPEQEDQRVRFEIISLLACLEEIKVEEYIQTLLKKNSFLTKEALFFLWKEKPIFSSELVELILQEEDTETRMQKAIVLALFAKEERAQQELEKIYFSANYEQKIQILEAMFQVGRTKNLPFFKKVLEEPFLTLRVLGASAFLQAKKR